MGNIVVLLRVGDDNDSFANASVRLDGDGDLDIRAESFLILAALPSLFRPLLHRR